MQQGRPFWEIMVPVPLWPGTSINLVFLIAVSALLLAGLALLSVLIVVAASRRGREHS